MSVIVLLVEGTTEKAVKEKFKEFLDAKCKNEGRPRVRLETRLLDSRLLNKEIVCDITMKNLKRDEVNGVVALMDVKCAGRPQQFQNAKETITYLQSCVPDEPRYRAHAAQFDFEAWWLPYWESIRKKVGVRKKTYRGKSGTSQFDEAAIGSSKGALSFGEKRLPEASRCQGHPQGQGPDPQRQPMSPGQSVPQQPAAFLRLYSLIVMLLQAPPFLF